MDFNKRIKNEIFWVTLIPTVLLLIQQVLAIFGVHFDYTNISEQLIGIIGTLFALLALLGVAVNPLTKGISDVDHEAEVEMLAHHYKDDRRDEVDK